ncbi:YceI family protein [Iodobacter fluviatilis]|uniref:Polyisoprenoid-binding protein n=1 Tax=Iodobacter fluviatilis TaxID=537 RepID=A0A7G3G673_9NEIS|nr:YceI family protein [Iodobacter fluviatilis]QBC42746.1 polyisoprenoid-binding protein [Iodobacter fluviatilis]
MIRHILSATLISAISLSANAAQTLVPQKSKVDFSFKQMGVTVDGGFKNFSAKVDFDPAKPEKAQAEIIVDLASIDVGGSDGNAEAKKKSWFDVAAFPKATFIASSIKALGAGKFEAKGKLTIKGISRDITTQLTTKSEAGNLVVEGNLPILRLQYKLGDGVWADTDTVADQVIIKFKIALAGTAGK